MKNDHVISKSQYLIGLQCPKALRLHRYRPDLKQVGEVCESRIQPQSAGVTGRAVLVVSRASEPVAVAERIQRELELVRNQH